MRHDAIRQTDTTMEWSVLHTNPKRKRGTCNRPRSRLGFGHEIPRTYLVCCVTVALLVPLEVRGQDDVVHRRNGIVSRGKILAYDQSGIRLRLETGRETQIPSEQIDRVEVKLTPEQEEGDALFGQKRYRAAAEKLEKALELETRPWLRTRIASKLIACFVAAGDPVGAIEAFFAAARTAGAQLSLAVVPTWWLPEPPGGAVNQYASSLMHSSNPLHQVIGASFLYGTDESATARETLARLTTYRDESVGQLARTQLWRWEGEKTNLEAITAWQQQATKLPADARGGPFFAIGLALRRLGHHDEAALAFLWPALVYRTDPKLSAHALLYAAECLEQAGQRPEAKQLYEEVLARYSPGTEANAAQQRLDRLKE